MFDSLKSFIAETGSVTSGQNAEKEWEKLRAKAKTEVDEQGAPVLQMQDGERLLRIGVSAGNG